jgi:hypothetical protein
VDIFFECGVSDLQWCLYIIIAAGMAVSAMIVKTGVDICMDR